MMNTNNWANWPTISELERAAEAFLGGYRVGVEYKGDGKFFYQMEIICGCPWSPDIDIDEGVLEYYTVYHMWLDLEKWKKSAENLVTQDDNNDLPF